MPMVTLATAPGLTTIVLPLSAIEILVAAGPIVLKNTTDPVELTNLPNSVVGVLERVHEPDEKFFIRSVS